MSEVMKEGMYYLACNSEEAPTLVHGYYCTDFNGEFGFGFNIYEGGGFLPLADLTEDSVYVPVVIKTPESIIDMRKNAIKQGVEYAHAKLCNRLEFGKDPRDCDPDVLAEQAIEDII